MVGAASWLLIFGSNVSAPPVPTAPTLSLTSQSASGTPTLSSVTNVLTWTSVAGATAYTLYRDGVQVYSGTNTTFTDVTGDTLSHVYTVTVTTAGGTSPSSNSVTAPGASGSGGGGSNLINVGQFFN